MATPIEVVDAAMQLLSHIAGGIKRAFPNKFVAIDSVNGIYAECEKAAYEQRAWYELIRALGDPDDVREALDRNADREDDRPAFYPADVSLFVEPDRRCLRRVSMMLVSDVWLARDYGDMVALMLSALEMHESLHFYGISTSPDSATSTIERLPVVFPRIEVVDGSALLCLTIELGHIASDGAYVAWARTKHESGTTVIRLQPAHFSHGLFSYVRHKLRRLTNSATLRVKRGAEIAEIRLDDAEREARVVSRFWNPTEYGAHKEDDNEYESEWIWGEFEDADLYDPDPPKPSGWCDLVEPQVAYLRGGVAQGIVRRTLPWPRSIRSARTAVARSERSAFQ